VFYLPDPGYLGSALLNEGGVTGQRTYRITDSGILFLILRDDVEFETSFGGTDASCQA